MPPLRCPDVSAIRYFNRHRNQMETEQVYGEGFLKFSYANPLGALPLHLMVKRAGFSRWYGKRMDDPATTAKIAPFLKQYGLDPAEFADSPDSYASFNEFFYRKLKPEARPIADSKAVFPADGRHLGFQRASAIEGVFVKGQKFDSASCSATIRWPPATRTARWCSPGSARSITTASTSPPPARPAR